MDKLSYRCHRFPGIVIQHAVWLYFRFALSYRDVEDILKNSEGKLAFWVTLRGGKADFARYYTPEVLAGSQTVKPSFVQNERTALRDTDGRYSAQCVYAFPADTIDPKGRVTLVVRDAEEKEVAKFTVDLAAMR